MCLYVEACTSSFPNWSTLSVVLKRDEEATCIFLNLFFIKKWRFGLMLIIVMVFCFAVPLTCVELKMAKTFEEELTLEEAHGKS